VIRYPATQLNLVSNNTFDGIVGGQVYRYHVFADSGAFTAAGTINNLEYIIVAGGGSGGVGDRSGGGGGAGGVLTNIGAPITLAQNTYSIVVGAGAAGRFWDSNYRLQGIDGSSTTFSGLTAIGGGGGGGHRNASFIVGNANGRSGGSGGGGGGEASASGTGGTGTAGQGFAGGNGFQEAAGGGGGGAGQVGSTSTTQYTGGNGGNGIALTFFPTGPITFGGGGGGKGFYQYGPSGFGGSGGGSAGEIFGVSGSAAGIDGSGGGSGGGNGYATGKGGDGIVILRYPLFSGNLYWRSRHKDADGKFSDWSTLRTSAYSTV
jgi:hypothetical protein